MQKSFSISVVVPVLNAEKYIGRCIRSLLKQTLSEEDYEIIVINDKSTDNTASILENECNSLYSKLINNEQNMGKGFSCRKGIEMSTGDVILIQDADLEYDPKDYIQMLECIKDTKIAIYGSRILGQTKFLKEFRLH